MSHLESLAYELWVMILNDLPNLASLYALICASPTGKNIFDRNPTYFVNKLIDETLPTELHKYPKWIAITGSVSSPPSPFASTTLNEFLGRYHGEIIKLNNQPGNVPALLPGLNNTLGPRKALLAADRVQRLADICLCEMTTRLHTKLTPGHPEGPSGLFTNTYIIQRPRHLQLVRVPAVSLKAPSPCIPSWIERFRVREAIWQILDGVSNSAVPGAPQLGVLRENREDWCQVLQPEFFTGVLIDPAQRGYQRGDPYDCANDTIRGLLGCTLAEMMAGQVTEQVKKHAVEIIRAASLKIPSDWKSEPQPAEGDADDRLGLTRRHANIPNYGMSYFITSYRWVPTSGKLRRQGLRALSLLGMSIWDNRRLLNLGLALPPGGIPLGSCHVRFTSYLDYPPGSQVAAWRSMFLQELRHLQGTWLGDIVINEDISGYLDAWYTEVAPADPTDLVDRMTEMTFSLWESDYDGPLQWEGTREFHREVLEDMTEVMDEYMSYHISRAWTTNAQGG